MPDRTPTDLKLRTLGDDPLPSQVDGTPTDQHSVSGALAIVRGTVLSGRWTLERCLASGGYGDVWEGYDPVLQVRVAVKILRTDAGNNDPSAIARMRQEAAILEAIDHPNIVTVYKFGRSPYGHFLVMELLDGKAIDQLLETEGPIDPERAIDMARQLLSALQVAHDKDVLHRDIKPENIIVVREADGTESARLLDFGIAKATRTLSERDDGATLVQTRAGGFMGTPRYAAPEQAVGDPCGPNIDLFALGLVLAEWLTGRRRMDGQTHGEVMQQLLMPQPVDLSDVPYRWREWLSVMTMKDPRQRYLNAEAALDGLEHLVVDLHQPSDFVDHQPLSTIVAGESAFASNDGPLELDFSRAPSRRPGPRAPTAPPPPSSRPPLAASSHPATGSRDDGPEITGTRPALFSTSAARRALKQVAAEPTRHVPVRREDDGVSRILLLVLVGLLSFIAFALLFFVFGGTSGS